MVQVRCRLTARLMAKQVCGEHELGARAMSVTLIPGLTLAPNLILCLQVLNDLADPSEGVYSATALMEERLSYTHRMLARHYQMPIVPEAGTKGRNANTNVRTGPESDLRPLSGWFWCWC